MGREVCPAWHDHSFSGVVTFKKATDIQEAARELPLDKILVETDAPYLAPVPKRGRENKTAYTRYVVDFIADLRGMTTEEFIGSNDCKCRTNFLDWTASNERKNFSSHRG